MYNSIYFTDCDYSPYWTIECDICGDCCQDYDNSGFELFNVVENFFKLGWRTSRFGINRCPKCSSKIYNKEKNNG